MKDIILQIRHLTFTTKYTDIYTHEMKDIEEAIQLLKYFEDVLVEKSESLCINLLHMEDLQ